MAQTSQAWHVGRTMRLLELLAFAPLSAPQLATALDAHPRTIRRVLARLVEDGYVEHSLDGRRVYEPTLRLVALAAQVVERSPLARHARPYVALLHERVGATAHLVVPSYEQVVCVVHCAAADAVEPPRLRELVPAHCTAGGKALLAWRDRWRDSLLAAPLQAHTDRTVTAPLELRRDLEAVRRAGYAVEDGEYQDGVRGVAAAVVVDDTAVAALGVSGRDLDVGAAARAVELYAWQLGSDIGRERGVGGR